MTDTPGAIPSPHEPFINPEGNRITRTWYRVLQALTKNSGQLAQPIVVKSNSFFVSGDINSGGTLEPATIPSGTLLGNSSGADAAASDQFVDPSLSFNNGTLSVAQQAADTLLGNPTGSTAVPQAIQIGAGLLLTPGSPATLSTQSSGGGGGSGGGPDLTAAQLLSWWRGG